MPTLTAEQERALANARARVRAEAQAELDRRNAARQPRDLLAEQGADGTYRVSPQEAEAELNRRRAARGDGPWTRYQQKPTDPRYPGRPVGEDGPWRRYQGTNPFDKYRPQVNPFEKYRQDESAAGCLRGGFYAHKDGELEPELGFTEEVDQQRRMQTAPGQWDEDGELSLGWQDEGDQTRLCSSDHDLEDSADSWADEDLESHDDEREVTGDEADTPGFIAGGNEEGTQSHSYGCAATGPAMFDGSGNKKAAEALLNAGPRADPMEARTIGERCHVLPSGEVMRTAVPYHSGYVRPSGALPDDDGPDMTDFSAYAPWRRGSDNPSRA